MPWLDLVLAVLALPVLAAAAYLALLALLARRGDAVPPRSGVRFDVVVPAHDEEAGVAETVRSLLALDYPRDLFRVIVVADNCSDRTRERAEAAGARALVRDDPERRGKGWALAYAFERLLAEGFADAFVVVDADSVVSSNLLAAFAARVHANGEALQARYNVRNPASSRRTRLMRLALTLFHDVRSEARERLRVSCGLRGNGMAFTRRLLVEVPHGAISLVEDLEYGIQLGLAGHRVQYVAEAAVLGEMAATESAARSQRRRWEVGRLQIARRHLLRLLWLAWSRRSLVLLDLALDLMVPPLSYLVLAAAVGLAASVGGAALGLRTFVAGVLWSLSSLGLTAYVARGLRASGLGILGVGDLMFAPAFALWKVALWLRPDARWQGEWVRTARNRQIR